MWNDVIGGLGSADWEANRDGSEGNRFAQDSGAEAPADEQSTQIDPGDNSGDELFNLAYSELYRLAQSLMNRQVPQHTLQATALVNEAWVRLSKAGGNHWKDRGHFVATASTAMRSVLVDHARKKNNLKRSEPGERVPLDDIKELFEAEHVNLLELDSALNRLAKMDRRLVHLVELRFFAGLSVDETAETLGVSARHVRREWETARTWLYKELQ